MLGNHSSFGSWFRLTQKTIESVTSSSILHARAAAFGSRERVVLVWLACLFIHGLIGEQGSQRFDPFVQRHPEKIGDPSRSSEAVALVKAHRACERFGRIERDAFAMLISDLDLGGL